MAEKRRCAGKLGNPKHPEQGRQCNKYAIKGSEFCQSHGGRHTDPLAAALGAHQCTAKSVRSGERCKRFAIRGGTVCKIHGGSTPNVQAKARERLMEMVNPALAQLNRILEAPSTSDSDRLRAVGMVLDRTGYVPGSTVEVRVPQWEQVMDRIVKEVPARLALDSNPDWTEDVIDAELVEDEPVNVTNIDPRMRGSAEPPRRSR